MHNCNSADLCRKDGLPFGESHLEKIKSLLPQSEMPSVNSLDSLYYFIAHISKSIVKPKLVQKALTEAGLDAERTEIFVNLWRSHASLIVNKLKEAAFQFSSDQLQDVDWKVKLLTEQSYDCQQKLPLAELDLRFNSKPTLSKLSLNFTHSELVTFYENLESIQSTIDQLNQ